jgi:hypothetical protein
MRAAATAIPAIAPDPIPDDFAIGAELEDEDCAAGLVVVLAVLPGVVCVAGNCVDSEVEEDVVVVVVVNPSDSMAPVVVKLRKLEPKTPPYCASWIHR